MLFPSRDRGSGGLGGCLVAVVAQESEGESRSDDEDDPAGDDDGR